MTWLRHRIANGLLWIEGFLYQDIGGTLSDWFGDMARKVQPNEDDE